MTRTRATILLGAFLLMLSMTQIGCVDEAEPDEVADLSSGRSFEEELMAEDIEALLPGTWRWDQSSTHQPPLDSEDLSIVFLGHNAVTGDVALLIETPDQDELQPARVSMDESAASLHLPETDTSFRVERIEDDVLVLQDDAMSIRLVYRRQR